VTPAARMRSRLSTAIAYLYAQESARELQRAIEREDIPAALESVALWAAWTDTSRKDLPR